MRGRRRLFVVVLLGVWFSGPDATLDANAADVALPVAVHAPAEALPEGAIAVRPASAPTAESFRYLAVRR